MSKKHFLIILLFLILSNCAINEEQRKLMISKDSEITTLKNSIETLIARNSGKDDRITNLNDQLNKSQELLRISELKFKETTDQSELDNKQISILKNEVVNLMKRLEEESKENRDKDDKIEKMDNDLKTAIDAQNKQNTEIKTRVEKIESLEKEAFELNNKINLLLSEKIKINEQITALTSTIEQLKKDNDNRLKLQIDKTTDIELQNQKLNEKIAGLNLKTAVLEKEKNKFSDELSAAAKKFEAYKTETETQNKKAIDEKNAEIFKLENSKNDEINKIASQNNKLREDYAALQAITKKNLEDKLNELQSKIKSITSDNSLISDKHSILQKEYNDYKIDMSLKLKNLENENEKIIKELEKSKLDEIKKLSSENFKIKEELDKLETKNQFLVQESQKGLQITFLEKILFDTGKADLKKQSNNVMKKVAEIINKYPKRAIIVEGHTDATPISSPKFSSNWELSSSRAISVLKYLINEGKVNRNRISAQGYADTKSVGNNAVESGRKLNRRVEIILLPEDLKIQKIETK